MNLHDIPRSLRNHFDQTPDALNGKLRISGTLISVEQVLKLLEAGVKSDEIVRSFPSLTEQNVTAVGRLAAYYALMLF